MKTISLLKLVIFFAFLFYIPFSFSLKQKNLFIAQEGSFFDDSDLVDIEGSDQDDILEKEFDTFDKEEVEDNFDKEEFEEEYEEEIDDSDTSEEDDLEEVEDEDFNEKDYEILSDKPSYEVVTDEDIEREFEEGSSSENIESPEFEDTEDIEEVEDLESEDEEGIEEVEDLESEDEEGIEEVEGLESEDEEGIEEVEDLESEDEEGIEEIEDLESEDTGDIEEIEDLESEDTEGIEEVEDLESEDTGDIEEVEDLESEDTGDTEEIEGLESEDVEEVEDLEFEDAEDIEEVESLEDEGTETQDIDDELEKDFIEDTYTENEDEDEDTGTLLNTVTNIRYLSSEDQIVIDCSEPVSYQVRRNNETNQFIIEILQARLVENLHWPYVLRDFNTQFGMIKADQKNPDTVRVLIQLKEGAPFPQHILTEDSRQILVTYSQVQGSNILKQESLYGDTASSSSILPAKTLEDLYFGDIQFSGFPISFHVIDAPVKQVLRFISEESGLNMVIGESVTGSVTLKLEDIPWDQALYTIFKVKSLGYTRDGNVITILPLNEIEERTKKLKQISDRQKSLSPYITKVIPINYGKIGDIEQKVKDFSTKKSDFVEGGRIIVHPESNTFVVIDTEKVVKKIEALVRYLDKPPKQVMVEAKIVEAQENFTKEFGLNWDMGGTIPVELNLSGNGFLNSVRNLVQGISSDYIIDSGGSSSLNVNGLPVIGNLQASLDLAESNNYAQVISTPKVVVISGKSASINRNAPILISKSTTTTTTVEGSSSEQSSLEPLDVSINLTVTPTVTTTGSVFLQLSVTRTDPGAGSTSGNVGGALTVNRTASTEVLVKNGQTIVIGGIYEKNDVQGEDGIPFLKEIPFFNMLFKTNSKSTSKTELLIFITPKLLNSHE